jgi:hypothetical protein
MATDKGQILKYMALGSSVMEVMEERQRQEALRERQPGAPLAKLLANASGLQDPAVQTKMVAAAQARAFPNRRPARKLTEIEQLFADMPKTSAQVVGSHKVPIVSPAPSAPRRIDELARMRTVFPTAASGEVGFHHDFGRAKTTDAAGAYALIGSLNARRVAADPELTTALSKLKAHVERCGQMADPGGRLRGIQARR